MMTAVQSRDHGTADVDVVVIGAGITGIYQLYRLVTAGFSTRVLEAAGGVGGTWFWNRYPAARFDSESYSYGYLFSEELFRSWRWKERFAGQPEIETYLNHVVDTFRLREHIRLNTPVESARFDGDRRLWTVTSQDGEVTTARFVVAATGALSAPFIPDVPGIDEFTGISHHTGRWPTEGVDFTGKRVAVVGTGASGVQIVPALVDQVASLTVYQRTAGWAVPLNNAPLSDEEWAEISNDLPGLVETTRTTGAGFIHAIGTRKTFDDSPEERAAFYEELWHSPGFHKVLSNYSDMGVDKLANDEFCNFVAAKIRSIVHDRDTAERLIPKDHGVGMKRVPMENGYYAAFNLPHVRLVDLRETPMVRVTATGIETTEGLQEFDIIVWATGFDAVTGALTRMQVSNADGTTLKLLWADGPRTYLGIQAPGFPNFFFVGGPHGANGNFPRFTEAQVDFVVELLEYARKNGYTAVEPEAWAEESWTKQVYDDAAPLLSAETAWHFGTNIPGKAKRFLLYLGGLPRYRQTVADVGAAEFDGFAMR